MLALMVLAGLVVGLGGAPTEAGVTAWVGWAIHAAVLRRTLETRLRLSLGWAFGFVANLLTCAWVEDLIVENTGLPTVVGWLGAVGLAALAAAPFALAAGWVGPLRSRVLWVGLYAAAHVLAFEAVPMLFPWRPAHSLLGVLQVVQHAEWSGPSIADVVVLVPAAVGAVAIEAPRWLVATALLIAAICAEGEVLLGAARMERARGIELRIGIVQPHHTVRDRMRVDDWPHQHEESWGWTERLQAVDVIAWPESAFPWALEGPEVWDAVVGARRLRAPLLMGAPSMVGSRRTNAVFAIEAPGRVTRVEKVRLMPFSERIPWVSELPILRAWVRPGLDVGQTPGVVRLRGVPIGVLNCYEDLHAVDGLRVTREGAGVLSSHSNDAWFGATRASELHAFLARMRAIETRRDLVRTTNTGQSGLVASTGEILERLPRDRPAAAVVRARVGRRMTRFVLWGDWASWPLIGFAIGVRLLAVLFARRQSNA